jgi:hypothetical protein
MQPLLGFTPDADPTTPGVITACVNFIPYENGMKAAPTGSTPASTPALAATCVGAVVVTKLDDTRRIFAGTATKLYELSAGSWADVSTGTYTGGSDSVWSYAQFGNSTLAANLADTIQRSNGSGIFAPIASAPKAKIIFSVNSFVMAMNTNDGAIKQNGWHCCATYDDTDWVASTTTLCAKGQLVSSPGQITAGGKLGDYAIAYKEKAIHIGQFVGAPSVWDWQQVPGGDAGCIGQDAWCDIGGAHFIVGQDNLWLFDGSRPQPIGVGQLRQWFFDNSNPAYRYKTRCIFDRQKNVVWSFYCSLNSTTLDSAIVYHVQTKQWGTVTLNVECALNYISAGATIDGLTSYSATIDGLSSYSFDSQYWLSGGRALTVFNTSHQLQLMTGNNVTSGFTTGDVGDDAAVSLLSRVRVRFAPNSKPTTATIQTFTKMEEGDSLSNGSSGSLSDGKFDVLQSARFHRAAFTFTGDCKVQGIDAVLTPEGER